MSGKKSIRWNKKYDDAGSELIGYEELTWRVDASGERYVEHYTKHPPGCSAMGHITTYRVTKKTYDVYAGGNGTESHFMRGRGDWEVDPGYSGEIFGLDDTVEGDKKFNIVSHGRKFYNQGKWIDDVHAADKMLPEVAIPICRKYTGSMVVSGYGTSSMHILYLRAYVVA